MDAPDGWDCVEAEAGYCRYVNPAQDAEIRLEWNAEADATAQVAYDVYLSGHLTIFDDTEFGQPDELTSTVEGFMELFGSPATPGPDAMTACPADGQAGGGGD